MNLTAYSDSESDNDAPPLPPPPNPAAKTAPRPQFQKVVDRSNPGRIKVNLPGALQQHAPQDDIEASAPPAKKPRLGGGFGAFNAMLPAPKKPNVSADAGASGATASTRGRGKGLAIGVNLKTGAEPAFKREPRVEADEYDEHGHAVPKEPMKKEDFRAMLNLPSYTTDTKTQAAPAISVPESQTEKEAGHQQVLKAAAPRFLPMSVGKGMKKKKKPPAVSATVAALHQGYTTPNNTGSAEQSTNKETKPAPRKAKLSLFGVPDEPKPLAEDAADNPYQPFLYGTEDEAVEEPNSKALVVEPHSYTFQHTATQPSVPATTDLTNIASELKLSEAERRQLFGKKGRSDPDFSAAKIVEFNTDAEYAHNEKLRQQGEQIQHNPLKSISGTGKNSLKSLVNVASTQKDALEDHFAAGHRNKKEAGNRYGW
jgi:hypothetical protein